ncbi:ABC transporter ATP-binding protein [Bradyrhizobium sp. KB893862 SZCCT0404]|nr:ABC transporter ATP-binding protein [Bradyrhizobium sp. KB893862 SZCCT0404]
MVAGNRVPVLEISGLSVRLPGKGDRGYAVRELSLTIDAGQTVCIVGESGSGKSVTAASVMRLHELPLEAGQILLQGEDVLAASDRRLRQLRGGRMGMIFQEPMTALNPVHRIGFQIEEALKTHGWGSLRKRKGRVIELLSDVHLPEPRLIAKAYPHQLSGGQRQRVMIAMALAMEPSLLIADEPTTALDVTTQAQILKLLKELQQKRNTAVLFITHDFGVVADIADQVIVMKSGTIVEQGDTKSVLYSPRHDYTKALIAAVPRLRPRSVEIGSGNVALRAVNLTKCFGERGIFGRGRVVKAVDSLSFEVRRGTTLGIVGESGSGKSTAARCVARYMAPDSGEVRIDDVDIAPLNGAALWKYRQKIQVVHQDPFRSLSPRRTIGQTLVEGPTNYGVADAQARERARSMLRTVGLDASAFDRYPHQFSGGQRQRIAIARALVMEPEILIADEAVSALDVSIQAQILELFELVRDKFHVAMLFITHDLRVAARLCDEIIVMKQGGVAERGRTQNVFSAPTHAYTRQLIAAIPGQAFLGASTSSD